MEARSRESQAVFACATCAHREHADVNAAKNIKAAGLAVSGRGDLQPLGGSAKRQPPRTVECAPPGGVSAARGISVP
ncbi:zinc ribbon domain-containing protein [Streptosporangium sp. NPDC087985]|uniref:zinc ribbon domain-containing protein n=1 Tax=Streptosporangium sp. NPDC087985 TaxID=3366196 RepID=UPI0037F175AC